MLLTPFLDQSRIRPDAPALTENGLCLSYAQFLNRAQAVAAALQCLGIRPGHVVAVYLDRGIDAAAAVFGTLLAGACYVPLDLKNPPSRLAFIIEDAGAWAIVGSGTAPTWLSYRPWLDLTTPSDVEPTPITSA
ncbi:MAG: AMP-binding protein, partial [Methylomonas sp.]|nr:AMP-binding protein [Methylomonas sp.]